MNRLLVTGMAIGADSGLCNVCNYDFDWLIRYPSVFIWADQILVTNTVWDVVQQEAWPEPPSVAKCCKLVLELAQAHGLVEVREPSPLLKDDLRAAIALQADQDLRQIRTAYAGRVSVTDYSKKQDGSFEVPIIDGAEYCNPYVGSVYSSLALARAWEANCLFDRHALEWLRLKFGMHPPKEGVPDRLDVFATVFESHLPNDPLIPYYGLCSEEPCKTCTREDACKGDYLRELEAETIARLKWRDYDEVREIKAVIDRIISRKASSIGGALDRAEIAREFAEQQSKTTRRIRSIFPKVRRWCNLATMVSVPFAVLGLAFGADSVTVGGAVSTAAAQFGKEYVDFLESKSRWVGFLQGALEDRRKVKAESAAKQVELGVVEERPTPKKRSK